MSKVSATIQPRTLILLYINYVPCIKLHFHCRFFSINKHFTNSKKYGINERVMDIVREVESEDWILTPIHTGSCPFFRVACVQVVYRQNTLWFLFAFVKIRGAWNWRWALGVGRWAQSSIFTWTQEAHRTRNTSQRTWYTGKHEFTCSFPHSFVEETTDSTNSTWFHKLIPVSPSAFNNIQNNRKHAGNHHLFESSGCHYTWALTSCVPKKCVLVFGTTLGFEKVSFLTFFSNEYLVCFLSTNVTEVTELHENAIHFCPLSSASDWHQP